MIDGSQLFPALSWKDVRFSFNDIRFGIESLTSCGKNQDVRIDLWEGRKSPQDSGQPGVLVRVVLEVVRRPASY